MVYPAMKPSLSPIWFPPFLASPLLLLSLLSFSRFSHSPSVDLGDMVAMGLGCGSLPHLVWTFRLSTPLCLFCPRSIPPHLTYEYVSLCVCPCSQQQPRLHQ
ncbi:hypothetical protein BKA57DRAFT_462848 [Linnemannia elongata]|nr:hypothetical protein BKA57DRAFT_462848 [Linnemannia elongata]